VSERDATNKRPHTAHGGGGGGGGGEGVRKSSIGSGMAGGGGVGGGVGGVDDGDEAHVVAGARGVMRYRGRGSRGEAESYGQQSGTRCCNTIKRSYDAVLHIYSLTQINTN
jgi:hypothetical protein